jgi:hypothetical protein
MFHYPFSLGCGVGHVRARSLALPRSGVPIGLHEPNKPGQREEGKNGLQNFLADLAGNPKVAPYDTENENPLFSRRNRQPVSVMRRFKMIEIRS